MHAFAGVDDADLAPRDVVGEVDDAKLATDDSTGEIDAAAGNAVQRTEIGVDRAQEEAVRREGIPVHDAKLRTGGNARVIVEATGLQARKIAPDGVDTAQLKAVLVVSGHVAEAEVQTANRLVPPQEPAETETADIVPDGRELRRNDDANPDRPLLRHLRFVLPGRRFGPRFNDNAKRHCGDNHELLHAFSPSDI